MENKIEKIVAVAINSLNNTACVVKSMSSFAELKEMWSLYAKKFIPAGWGGCLPLDKLVNEEHLKLDKEEFKKSGEVTGKDYDQGKYTEWSFNYDTIRSAKVIDEYIPNEDEIDENDYDEIEITDTKSNSKPKELNPFESTIKAYLEDFAAKDMDFKGKYENPNKSIQECCNYIYGQVQQSGRKGFNDDEIYQMARHYYQEDIKEDELKGATGNVVVNHVIELTEEEKQKAHDEAVKKLEAEELKKLKEGKKKEALEQVDVKKIEREAIEKYKADLKAKEAAKKEAKAKAEAERKAKEEAQGKEQTSLFDFL